MAKHSQTSDDGRIKKTVTDLPNGKIAVDVNCSQCGKPITETNAYGMYCKDFCGMEDDKKAARLFRKLTGGFFDGVAPKG